jgi:hypothetical protein
VKRSSRMQAAFLLVLGAVVAALGLVNWWVLRLEPASPPPTGRIVLASVTAMPALAARPSDDRSLSDFDDIVRRPVFSAGRRPFVAPESTIHAPIKPPPDIKLVGIAIDAGKKQALLRTPQQPRGRWVGEGESMDGWLVRSVRGDAAIVASGQQTHELRLYPTQPAPKQ